MRYAHTDTQIISYELTSIRRRAYCPSIPFFTAKHNGNTPNMPCVQAQDALPARSRSFLGEGIELAIWIYHSPLLFILRLACEGKTSNLQKLLQHSP